MTSMTIISFNDAAEKAAAMFQTSPAELWRTMGFTPFLRHYLVGTMLGENTTERLSSVLITTGLPEAALVQWTGWVRDAVSDRGFVFTEAERLPVPIVQIAVIAGCQSPCRLTLD